MAKVQYRLSRTAIALMRHYVLRTSDEDYLEGRICAVWAQVCRTARVLNLSPRSINYAERELETAGFLVRSTGNNGSRSGDRCNGRITWAAGANLGPLIQRYQELLGKAQAMRLRNRAIDQCKAEIRQINRAIRKSEVAEAKTLAADILPDGRTARINDLERLEDIKTALAAVLVELEPCPGARKTSDRSEENCAPDIPPEESSKICSGSAAAPPSYDRITPRLAAVLATDEYRSVLDMYGGVNWPAIVETSFQMALQMGVDQRTWQTACARLGRERAALCIIIIQRNAVLDVSHRYHVKRPNGCLAGMVESSLRGQMNLAGLVGAILDRTRAIPAKAGCAR
ncbi:replication initiation protein RepC [Sphingopyxis indica]|uniref:replication initiation protein RepC n=1 Tax=Sphingopyxis indica TaxID=436663 RepID=UPI0029394FFB|nr:replication initiation protein RepC [Sphingopyxis indica]